MINISTIIKELKAYDGPEIKLMEVCGTHTASIFKHGIKSLISPKIKLISGPGCPVCVTPGGYIDAAILLAKKPEHVLLTFGDMLKVPGSEFSLENSKGTGANVQIIYSPQEALALAAKDPGKTFILAAVGFETTVPAFSLVLEKAIEEGIKNIRFLTAFRRVIPALEWVCQSDSKIDGFISPGHVSTILGTKIYEPLARKYHKPFVIAGFAGEHVLVAIYDLLLQITKKKALVHNLYPSVVSAAGNQLAVRHIFQYFETEQAAWRGLGVLPHSGLVLKKEFRHYDAGYQDWQYQEELKTKLCRCGQVITGRITPEECPLFNTLCNPSSPQGPCMVSSEGACGIYFRHRK